MSSGKKIKKMFGWLEEVLAKTSATLNIKETNDLIPFDDLYREIEKHAEKTNKEYWYEVQPDFWHVLKVGMNMRTVNGKNIVLESLQTPCYNSVSDHEHSDDITYTMDKKVICAKCLEQIKEVNSKYMNVDDPELRSVIDNYQFPVKWIDTEIIEWSKNH